MSTQSVKEVIEATIENSAPTPPSVSTVPSEQRGADIDGLGKDGVDLNTSPDNINVAPTEGSSPPKQDSMISTSQPTTTHYGNPAYYPFPNNISQPPASPGGAANLASAGYIQDLFMKQQQGVGNLLNTRQQYPNNLQGPPLSPLPTVNVIQATGEEGPNLSMGTIAPASPLFPGTVGFGSNPDQQESSRLNGITASPASPSIYPLSPLYSNMYHGGPASIPNSPETRSWSDRNMLNQPQMYPPSPQVMSMQVPYPGNGQQHRRTGSFDELLPPSALEESPNAYVSSNGTGNPFSQGQPWGLYSPNIADPYATTQSSPQQMSMPPHPSGPSVSNNVVRHQLRQPPSGSYYPAATPGPPIQTTHHNKGPEGANLFIFHIPNHFTNLDMWHLFCHYGNLLSVRIMVEKDTGRSRGFGFVSYDSPAAAANAIKELNGFVIGNKRLKVQHKQIRSSENNPAHQEQIHSPPLIPQSHAPLPPTGQPNNQIQTLTSPEWREAPIEITDEVAYPTNSASTAINRPESEVESSLNNLNSIRDALPENNPVE